MAVVLRLLKKMHRLLECVIHAIFKYTNEYRYDEQWFEYRWNLCYKSRQRREFVVKHYHCMVIENSSV